jgi:YggT family protein
LSAGCYGRRGECSLADNGLRVYIALEQQELTMLALLQTIDFALNIFVYLIIASAIYSWLYAFNVVNTRNPFVAQVGNFLYRVTEPALRPIRRVMPDLGGVDISPIVLFVIIFFIRQFMWTSIAPLVL